MGKLAQEQKRLSLQARLDGEKSQADRNRLGQFAAPTALARDIVLFRVALLGEDRPIRFLEGGKGEISERCLCRSRTDWYFQEERPPAPLLRTYRSSARADINATNGWLET